MNALGLWKEAAWEGHLGPEVTGEGGRLASSRNLLDWESRCLDSSGMGFSSFLALSLGMGGDLPSPAKSFKQRHERSPGSTHSGQVQSQNGKDRSSPGDTQPPARQLGTHSPVCLPKTSGWMVFEGRVADSRFMGVVLINGGDELRKTQAQPNVQEGVHACWLFLA